MHTLAVAGIEVAVVAGVAEAIDVAASEAANRAACLWLKIQAPAPPTILGGRAHCVA